MSDSSIPATCWIAPEIPIAKYTLGRTVLPVCPTWRSTGSQPFSTTAREQLTVPPSTSAKSWRSLKFSSLPTPRPPDTKILASAISTVSATDFTTSRISTYLLSGVNPGLYSITSAFAPLIGSIFCITPARTVAICGRLYGHAIVAIVLPPNAGRVIRSWFGMVSFVMLSVKSPISSTVQSAVRPVATRADTRGPKSRPIAVAPTNIISGLYSLITEASAWAYGSVRYTSSSLSSTTITLSAPYSAKESARSLTP